MAVPKLEDILNTAAALVRVLGATARGPGRQALQDIAVIDPDTVGMGKLIGLHVDIAASGTGTDVNITLNPDYVVAIHSIRAAVEVGTAEATANSGQAAFSAAHCSVRIWDKDRNKNLTESTSPAAGTVGGIDLMLLGANNATPVELKVPYVFNQKNATLTATFATDADWPGTRRAGVLLSATYRRTNFRQAETL